jgi:O-antigen/teichoic acid export membrane protein
VLRFAVPLLATNIVTPLLTMTDTAFVGRCAADSVVQLAALGVSTPLTDYTVTLAAFIPAGLTNIISNGVAAKESKQSLGAKTYGALIVSFCLSLLVAGILILHTETLLSWLKTPKEVMAAASAFTKIRAIGMPAAYLTTAAYAILVARKDTVSPLACVCLAATVNVLLDYLAVARMGMGAAGAAWATTVALWVGCGAILDVGAKTRVRGCFSVGHFTVQRTDGAGDGVFRPDHVSGVRAVIHLHRADFVRQRTRRHRLRGAQDRGERLRGRGAVRRSAHPSRPGVHAQVPFAERPAKSGGAEDGGLLQQVGFGAGAFAGTACAVTCLFGGGAFTNDAAVVSQVRAVVVPMCAAVVANVVSKSMYGVTVAAKQLVFLAAITGAGLVLFALALWRMNAVLVGPALYYWMWWVVAGYYALAIVCIQVLTFGGPGGMGFKGLFHDAPVEKKRRRKRDGRARRLTGVFVCPLRRGCRIS